MNRDRSNVRRLVTSLTVGPALLLLALVAPVSVAAAGPITSAACAPTGATAVTCNLWAKVGTGPTGLSLPGGVTSPIWGFAAASGDGPSVPGPVLIVNSGDEVTVNLTNQLPVTTAILFEGQPMAPDLSGVAAGGPPKAYTFTAGAPGTYLYEAGLLPGTQYQAAKGLYGALIVRPAGGLMQANDNAATAFDDEALVVLGEVDTALNSSATPATFDLRGYRPRYFLINGKAYPDTSPVTTASGNRLLLRYVNAGLQHHSMGVLGLRQTVVNDDGTALANPRRMVAESLAPGQATDVLVDIPTSTASSTRYILYDASMGLNNTTGTGTNAGIGGMLTLIDAAGSGSGGDTVGPVTSGVTIDVTTDPTTAALSASVSDASTGGASVSAAEYFVDTIGAPGSGTAMTGTFPSDPASVSASFALGSLSSGNHTVFVHGKDGLDNWGATTSVSFSLDTAGPTTSAITLNPVASNGSAGVNLTATADDRSTGGANIAAAEYFIDVAGADGAGSPMNLSTLSAPVSSLSVTIPQISVNALVEGPHAILVHSQDALGNWGPTASATLTIDKSGPVTSAVTAAPNPNNGTFGINTTNPSVRVQATFDDTNPAYVKTGEAFIDVLGSAGTGIPVVANDGLYNTAHELGYADIPLTSIVALADGNHTIYVRGRDSAGNWGVPGTATLVIDKTGPTTSGVTLTPPAANAQAVAISASATDPAPGSHNVVAAEFFIDTTGVNGAGTAMTVASPSPTTSLGGTIPAARVAALSAGDHTVYVHARDSIGNWGPRASAVLRIDRTAPTFSSITLSPNPIASGTASTGLAVNGASDGATGSGVAGGEFWIANSNVPAGGGTAFNGTTATIPTGGLVPGAYTVRVRIRDVAGNWSTGNNGVRTATLTVTGPVPDAIFSDGFELQTLPGTWTSVSTTNTTRINVTAAAALAGSLGLQAQGNNTNYVQYSFGTAASPATAIYDAKFLFRPNAKATAGQDILSGATNSGFGTQVFRVRYRLNGSTPQVQIQVGTSTANATWTTITGGTTANTIEVVWQAVGSGGPNPGTLRLYVNGALSQTLTTSSTSSVGAVRLGAVTGGGGSSTAEYFDAFASKRSAAPFGP
jgi:FtsP/CotA-like multicopper oxidase with cupredoxin domain